MLYVPYLIGLQIKDSHLYHQFVNGNGFDQFLAFVESSSSVQEDVINMVYRVVEAKTDVDPLKEYVEILKEIYTWTFNESFNQQTDIKHLSMRRYHDFDKDGILTLASSMI